MRSRVLERIMDDLDRVRELASRERAYRIEYEISEIISIIENTVYEDMRSRRPQMTRETRFGRELRVPKKRKLSKWQKFVKANSKKKQFIYQSGAKKGKLNLKKMGIAYRRQNK